MKKFCVKICQRLFLFQFALYLCQTVSAAVTLTNTPSTVSNTYSGIITLQVGGLTNGETVVVQKFLDANANNVADAGDLLVEQFDLTDGTSFVIGGVTNLNVPGDNDPVGGQITATLNFQNGDFVQDIVGKYIFVLSSPVGHFAVVTNFFSVTNSPYAQTIAGSVVSSGTNVPNAVVILFPPPRSGDHGPGNPRAAALADNSGNYSIQVPPGTYVPLAFRGNYVADFLASPVVTVTNGQTVNANLTLTNATASISGQVVDLNNPGIGLPGLLLPSSANSLITVGFTDTNGNFTLGVRPGTWSLEGESSGLIVHGYVGYQNGTNVAAGATGVIAAFPKATAMFYGSVKDNLGNPLVGIDLFASDNNGQYQVDGYSDNNGNYVVCVLGGLGGGNPWQLQVDNGGGSSNPANYIYSQTDFQQYGGTNLNVGQAVQQNFTARLATNFLTGRVQFNGTNIAGVGVSAIATIGGLVYSQYADTDTNGIYQMNVANGDWSVSLNCSYGGSDSLDNILGSGTYQCPNSQNATINNHDATNNFIVQPCGGIQILTTSLPVGEVNLYYDQFLQGSSCSGGLSWSFVSGSTDGLGLSGSGELSGLPGSAGVFNFTVQANDGVNTTNQQLSLIISNAVAIVSTLLPDGTNGAVYSQQLQASGGVPFGGASPYSWSLATGSLPANLNLATNGVISGTPTTNGTFNFGVQVEDSLGVTYYQPLSLTINSQSAPLQITTTLLPDATQNVYYTTTLAASGGLPPYNWSLAPGSASLPLGMALATNGVISGTPISSGTNGFIVVVTDVTAAWTYQFLTLTVNSSAIPPVIFLNAPQRTSGGFQFTFNTASGVSYIIQYSTDLKNWNSLLTFEGSGGPITIVDPNAPGNSRGFYRIKVGP